MRFLSLWPYLLTVGVQRYDVWSRLTLVVFDGFAKLTSGGWCHSAGRRRSCHTENRTPFDQNPACGVPDS